MQFRLKTVNIAKTAENKDYFLEYPKEENIRDNFKGDPNAFAIKSIFVASSNDYIVSLIIKFKNG